MEYARGNAPIHNAGIASLIPNSAEATAGIPNASVNSPAPFRADGNAAGSAN
jgi:uncharacterized protein YpuA (DUF1002 family)